MSPVGWLAGVDAGGELVGVGVQRCQQRDVVVFGIRRR